MIATSKTERLLQLERLLLAHPEGITRAEIGRRLSVHRSTAMRYITELSILLPIWEDDNGRVGIERDDYLKSLGLDHARRISVGPAALISRGESEFLEFKVAACWNSHRKAKDSEMIGNIVKTVAGFMNGKMGGVILIGVTDDGKVVGLVDDYRVADARKQNRDGYELFLRNAVNDRLGGNSISFYDVSFHQLNGMEICQIQVKPASQPTFLDGAFFVRNGNQTRQLTTQEAIEYIRNRWGS